MTLTQTSSEPHSPRFLLASDLENEEATPFQRNSRVYYLTYNMLIQVRQIGETAYKVYETFVNSTFFHNITGFLSVAIPNITHKIIHLDGPLKYLKVCAVAGFLACGIKINTYRKKFKNASEKTTEHLFFKIIYNVGLAIEHAVKIALACEAFKWTGALTRKGYHFTASVIKKTALFAPLLAIVIWTLTLPKILINTNKICAAEYSLEKFKLWRIRVEKRGSAEESFRYLKNSLSTNFQKQIYKITKFSETKQANWINNLNLDSLDGDDNSDKVALLLNALEGRIKLKIINLKLQNIVDATYLISTAILFGSMITPLGYTLVAAHALFSFLLTVAQKVQQYEFEHRVGLFKEPDEDEEKSVKLRHVCHWLLNS